MTRRSPDLNHMTEKQKMLAGQLYDAADPELTAERQRARSLMHRLNVTDALDDDGRPALLAELLGAVGPGVEIVPPFRCDYGRNIHLGPNVYMNFGCVLLDVCEIRIGEGTMLGPYVQLYAATHTLDAETRRRQLELGKPITIGADCWLGGGSIVLPGATVGDRCVIGAGSVVTRDIPADSVAVGNPARVVRNVPAGPQ
jgi:maltose O-acetyltransferase